MFLDGATRSVVETKLRSACLMNMSKVWSSES